MRTFTRWPVIASSLGLLVCATPDRGGLRRRAVPPRLALRSADPTGRRPPVGAVCRARGRCIRVLASATSRAAAKPDSFRSRRAGASGSCDRCSREEAPERARVSRVAMDVDGQLLAKRELHDGLVLSTPEESNRAAHDRSDESKQRPEHHSILVAAGVEWEPESGAVIGLEELWVGSLRRGSMGCAPRALLYARVAAIWHEARTAGRHLRRSDQRALPQMEVRVSRTLDRERESCNSPHRGSILLESSDPRRLNLIWLQVYPLSMTEGSRRIDVSRNETDQF